MLYGSTLILFREWGNPGVEGLSLPKAYGQEMVEGEFLAKAF